MVQIIPFYDRLVLPSTRYVISCKDYKTYCEHLPKENDMIIFVFLKQQAERNDITAEMIYPLGIRGKLYKTDGDYLIIDLEDRLALTDIKVKDGRIYCSIDTVYPYMDRKENVFTDSKHFTFWGLIDEIKLTPDEKMWFEYCRSYEGMLSGLSSRLDITAEEKYMLLAEDDLDLRSEMVRYLFDGLVIENFTPYFSIYENENIDLLELLENPEIRQRGIEFVEHFRKLRERKHHRRHTSDMSKY